jgi:outer membrane receptor protein involved in Fe transport
MRLRGDYNINENTKLFFSWSRQDETDLNPISVWWYAGNSIPYPSSMPANQVSQVYSANLTHSFSPALTNEFIFADATFINPIGLTKPCAVNPSNVGFSMTGLFNDKLAPQVPNTTNWAGVVPGYLAPTFGQTWQGGDFGKLSQAPNIADNITKVAGTHTLKAGFYWDFARNQQTSTRTMVPNTTRNSLADFATARITGFTQSNAAPVQDFRYHQYSFFLNDQWKTSRRLTLTLGVRFDHMDQWAPTGSEGLAVWDPHSYNEYLQHLRLHRLQWHAIEKLFGIRRLLSRAYTRQTKPQNSRSHCS